MIMVVWWHVFNFNKVTKMSLLLWQGISQHVATIIFFSEEASASPNLKDKGRERGMLLQAMETVILYVRENLFLTSSSFLIRPFSFSYLI